MIQIDLSGKTAIVTGGGQGLGAATCQMLSKAGANVMVNYFNDSAGINRKGAEQTVAKLGNRAKAVEADVQNVEQVRKMVEKTVSHFGSLDIVINNAGIMRDRTLKKMSHEEWNSTINTNLTGVFNVCKESIDKLSDGGRIVNLSSVAASVGFFGTCNYSAAKAGIVGFTRVLCRELAKRKITVNAVAPGIIDAGMGSAMPEKVKAELIKFVPLGRFGEAEEVASVILFLCSDLASYITGQVIGINGGWV